MKSTLTKKEKEKRRVEERIRLYCMKNHGASLCLDCQALIDYAKQRSELCPFMEEKTFCSSCKVHCYQPTMRMKIKEVMRFGGPRMLFHHPVMAISHLIEEWREKNV